MNDHADELIYAAASAMHSIAATLTGEAKLELSKLRKLLSETNALPRDQALLLAQGVAEVREHLALGPTPDPVGDGNRIWDVFSAAWAIRQESRACKELDLKVFGQPFLHPRVPCAVMPRRSEE